MARRPAVCVCAIVRLLRWPAKDDVHHRLVQRHAEEPRRHDDHRQLVELHGPHDLLAQGGGGGGRAPCVGYSESVWTRAKTGGGHAKPTYTQYCVRANHNTWGVGPPAPRSDCHGTCSRRAFRRPLMANSRSPSSNSQYMYAATVPAQVHVGHTHTHPAHGVRARRVGNAMGPSPLTGRDGW